MKVKMSHLFLTIILIFLILLTMSNTCVTFKPHYTSSINYAAFETFKQREGMTKNTKKEGFTGLDGAKYGNDAPIDKFSGTKGSAACDGISSGLTNSKGGLCLSDSQQQLLRTRGGNATGGDSQIGK